MRWMILLLYLLQKLIPLFIDMRYFQLNDDGLCAASSMNDVESFGDTFKNVYALSESMEPIKVIETPRKAIDIVRSVTARDALPEANEHAESQPSSAIRGSSAPVTFKPVSRMNRLERLNDFKRATIRDVSDDVGPNNKIHMHDQSSEKRCINELDAENVESIINALTSTLTNVRL
ncbi:unnamed protein product [Anisakis simplex]|uniref:Secreted protein n=1 Tax=Anisakis simplex TaxID=6269 RepID=A0A0M3J410_ANISI|nr:unnamed protein product [Anisakis simplex]